MNIILSRKNIFLILMLVGHNLFSQDKSAAIVDPFSLSPDNLGTISNAVNLFTGDLTLPLNLVSIPGRGNLGISVSAVYSSANIENYASTWNLDAPTSVLGLGWSLQSSKVIVDNNQTMSRDDDTFYIQENGSSVELICVGINSSTGVRTFKTKIYSNKIITYTPSTERWDITLEDGTKMIYGNTLGNGGSAVQWTLGIGNWIGNSNQFSSATGDKQGVAWNLSQTINIYGDQVNYFYTKTENSVGSGSSPLQTEASYLTSITSSFGYEVDLIYKNKLSQEVMEPHTEQNEPDAYQEVYESMYLDKLLVKGDGNQVYEIDLRYSFYSTGNIAAGNNTKRLLSSMVKVGSGGLQSPTMSFGYLSSGPMAGALNTVTTPSQGTVTYEYSSGQTLNTRSNYQSVSADANYGSPQVFSADDYTVITWIHLANGGGLDYNNAQPIEVNAYSWEGEWKMSPLAGNMQYNNVKIVSGTQFQDFQVSTQRNFFALLMQDYSSNANYYYIYIWSKSDETIGSWDFFTDHIQFNSGSTPALKQLLTGDNFVAVSDNYGKLFRYVWNRQFGSWSASVVPETTGTHYTTATNNFIISHNAAVTPNVVNYYYLDAQKNWVGPNQIYHSWNSSSYSSWYASNSQAAVINSGSSSTYLYYWNSSLNAFTEVIKPFNLSSYPGCLYFSNNVINLGLKNTLGLKALRFNGTDWVDIGTVQQINGVGEDLCGYVNSGNGQSISVFDPNANSWVQSSFTSVSGIQQAGVLTSGNYNYRLPNGNWFSTPYNLAYGYFAYPQYISDWNTAAFLKNGGIQGTFSLDNFSLAKLGVDPQWATNSQFTFVIFNNLNSTATQLYLIRADPKTLNASTTNNYVFIDYPIDKITVFDGIRNYYTSFKYELSTAMTDPGLNIAQYNKVTTIPGSSTISPTPYGYKETYFFNGISDQELGDVFPSGNSLNSASSGYKLLTGQVYRTKGYDLNGNKVSESDISFSALQLPVYNSNSIGVGSVKVVQVTEVQNIVDGIQRFSDKYYDYLPTFSTPNGRGQLIMQSDYTLSGSTKQEVVTSIFNYGWKMYPNSLQAENILSPVFESTRYLGGQIIGGNNTFSGGQVIEASVTRYNENYTCSTCQGTIPVPYDQYSWNGTGTPSAPPASITQAPSSDWVFGSLISQRDAVNGVETEVQGKGGQIKSQIWDAKKRFVVGTTMNCSASLNAYSSFEDASYGNWTPWGSDCSIVTGPSKTGNNYLVLGATGVSKGGLNATDTYTISFWAKTNNVSGSVNISSLSSQNLGNLSAWTFFQFNVSGVTSIALSANSGANTVYIDELRIIPIYAQMSTATYHPLYGTTSKTDTNNQTAFVLYDGLGRPVNTVDENGNIVKNTIYNMAK